MTMRHEIRYPVVGKTCSTNALCYNSTYTRSLFFPHKCNEKRRMIRVCKLMKTLSSSLPNSSVIYDQLCSLVAKCVLACLRHNSHLYAKFQPDPSRV